MFALLLVPAGLQAAAMAVDEGWFHLRRGLPRWERIGHPVDTATVAACYGWLLAVWSSRTSVAVGVYAALAVLSCLVVTKDEWKHARLCGPGEHWLHAVLFVLHPVVLAAFGAWWWYGGGRGVVIAQLALTAGFGVFQIVYWNLVRGAAPATPSSA